MPPRQARIGLIGAGWWATSNHLPILASRSDVDLVGVCRLGAEPLEQVRRQFGFRFATEDYRELLDRCELDGVVVASPHTLHFEHARAALQRGLHVLCEKPLCTRAADARELVRLAETGGLHLVVPYGWNYKPFIQQAKRWMEDEGVGQIEYALCHMASPIRDLLSGRGMRIDEVSGQQGHNLFEPDPSTWADPQVAGGGYGHAQISHSAGLLFWLTDLVPQTVFARMTAPDSRVDLYDAVSVQFAGGAIGTISGAGTLPTHLPFQVDVRVFGRRGVLLLDCERARLELHHHDGCRRTCDLALDAGHYECVAPVHHFVDLILGRADRNWSPGTPAMRSVELLDAAYRSAKSGHPEPV